MCSLEAPNYLWPIERHYRIFYPPLIPKAIGKLYLKLRGKNTEEIKNINYVTPRVIFKYFNKSGFTKIVNCIPLDIKDRLESPEKMQYSRNLKRCLLVLKKNQVLYCLIMPLFRVLTIADVYPSIKFKAIK